METQCKGREVNNIVPRVSKPVVFKKDGMEHARAQLCLCVFIPGRTLNKFTDVCRVVSFYIRHHILLLILESSHHSTRSAISSRTENTTQIRAAESWVVSRSTGNSKEQNLHCACDSNLGRQDVLWLFRYQVFNIVFRNPTTRPYPKPVWFTAWHPTALRSILIISSLLCLGIPSYRDRRWLELAVFCQGVWTFEFCCRRISKSVRQISGIQNVKKGQVWNWLMVVCNGGFWYLWRQNFGL
jgi:hypothetical protein